MTNATTPSVKIVDIGGTAHTLKFNFGMARLAEQELGVSLMSAFRENSAAMNTISAVWWAALQANHPMSREAADELIDAAGLEQVTTWLVEGLGQYFGGGKASPEGAPGNAPKTGQTHP
ncbi:hypothetical protein [Sphingopyxis witflariensis]|uniref:Phage tail tube protein, GTA-gp10 n=1 Tax=Sphingopyxis witflariensis TaxID=173675 RepID=A0A2D0ANC8_9SPHN|nr:hypothetical protein [Sphingopyxis witflariensis]OWQ95115.1 hypothetical protein CDQ91_14435 [Sphingopyxis witflariensis]